MSGRPGKRAGSRTPSAACGAICPVRQSSQASVTKTCADALNAITTHPENASASKPQPRYSPNSKPLHFNRESTLRPPPERRIVLGRRDFHLYRRRPVSMAGMNSGFRRRGVLVGCLLYTSDAADDLLCVDLG